MGRRREETKPDRFLFMRGDTYQYVRRVPAECVQLDNRAPMIRTSLKTSDLAKAMALRDLHERADNEFWAALLVGTDADVAARRYRAAVARAAALGFTYRSAADYAAHEPAVTILDRVEKSLPLAVGSQEDIAVLGLAVGSDQCISAAFDTYTTDIARDEIRFKSEAQKHTWRVRKLGSINLFISICGDKRMSEITRDDALKVHKALMARVAPEKGRATLTANMANRHLSNLRGLYRDWYNYRGHHDAKNPFANLTFAEGAQKSRPSFSVEWIKGKLLAPGALGTMNDEARGILLAMVETGTRLSEIANLTPENIVLDADVPHINIAPSDDPDDPREIKTKTSIRAVPLVGVSLAVMKKHKRGFPRYRDKTNALSATINKFLKENELLETDAHSVYSLRHSFEDRMKEARVDEELRRILMGHAIDRPKYGNGGSLELKQAELNRIVLPFDPKIV